MTSPAIGARLTPQAQMYSILSLFFLYPDKARMTEIETTLDRGAVIINALQGRGYPLANEWRNLAAASRENMPEKYTALFISGYPATPCLPYGSVYLDKSLYGGSAEPVRKLMKEYNLAPGQGNEPLDHISIILELSGLLAANNHPLNALLEYLQHWVYEFLERLKSGAPENHFYCRLAHLAAGFLRQEMRHNKIAGFS
ncbi:MAG: molecular chaperone TorD family protein [Planctomycetes bacterium]|nr:molecular chaperone TorD family protein [Planctomycetota bacterium]